MSGSSATLDDALLPPNWSFRCPDRLWLHRCPADRGGAVVREAAL